MPRFFQQADRLCMGASVDYCDAVVEAGFMSLARNLPTDAIFHKKKTPKWILKELATRYVPREIAFQKKCLWMCPSGNTSSPRSSALYSKTDSWRQCSGWIGTPRRPC